MEFSRQEYWRGLPFPSPGDLPHPGVEPGSPASWVQFSSVQSLSRVRLFATPWAVAHKAPPSMEFSRQEYWRGLPFPRLVITSLPRSKRLLISWLQSPSAVILEPRKIKSSKVSTVSPFICHEVMGPDAMILVF